MKIAVFGNYGVQNLGDDLILLGIQQQLKNDEILVFCGNPDQVRKQFSLEAFPFFPGGLRSWFKYFFSGSYRQEIRKSFMTLRGVDKILIGGGGILVDRHFKAVVLWWAQLRMIAGSGKPFEFIGNSLELKKWWSKHLLVPFLKKAQALSARDSTSQVFLESFGLKAALVDDLSQHATLEMKHRVPEKKIALALCTWGLGTAQKISLQGFLEKKKQEGYRLIGFAFQTVGDDDRKILEEIVPGMEVVSDLEDILEALRTCRVLVAMRYHAVLLGLRFGIPLIALSYQEKVSNLLKDRSLLHLCIPIQKIDEQSLQELFGKAVEAEEK